MDDTLSKKALQLIKWAPLFLLFNGYWMLSNQQIFNNKWHFIERNSDSMDAEHHIQRIDVNWATPVQVMAFASVFIIVLQTVFAAKLQRWGFSMSPQDIIVDEDLPNFFSAIKLAQADEIILENKNLKENYGFEIEDPRLISIIDQTKIPKKAIQGTPWYNVLSNATYSDDFNYIGAHIDEREKLIKDADDDDDNNCE